MEEVSQLGCMGSRNKLQRQKKGPQGLEERTANKTHLGEGGALERKHVLHPPLEGFDLQVSGAGLNRISAVPSGSSGSFMVCTD